MELPVELVTILTGLIAPAIVYVVVEGVKAIVEGLGGNMDGIWGKAAKIVASALSAAAVAIVIGLGNAFLGLVPEAYAPIVAQGLQLLILILGGNGLHRIIKKQRESDEDPFIAVG